MRLKALKLSGFKSFVEPTKVLFPSPLVGIVGPNGCGKSNIIDAVRWVMGESSAKTLRGESMSDVIFNGSSNRKPVGQASVELVFDNNEGRLSGEYGQYAEIAIKRVVTRDGQSAYYLNNTRCRRKDVADIFLGTGLGSRSYAIIGQNTISQLIEAKPEDLRMYIEEAAGISKYKERRKEAQSRMENTRENLARVSDLREELGKQVARLERQAAAATEYAELDKEAKQFQAECDVLRWQGWHDEWSIHEKMIEESRVFQDSKFEELRQMDENTAEIKAQHEESLAIFNQEQAAYYALEVESARLKEAIVHRQNQQNRLMRDAEQTRAELAVAAERLSKDEAALEALVYEIERLTPETTQYQEVRLASEQALAAVESEQRVWQKDWDTFNQSATAAAEKVKILQTRLEHLEENLKTTESRLKGLASEHTQLEKESRMSEELKVLEAQETLLREKLDDLKCALEDCVKTWTFYREQNEEKRHEGDQVKKQLQELQGELTALEALQSAALGKKNEAVKAWLGQQSFAKQPRLAQILDVEEGWDNIVERILGDFLQGICVEDFQSLEKLDDLISDFPKGDLALVNLSCQYGVSVKSVNGKIHLLDKIRKAPDVVKEFLKNIYVAENIAELMAIRSRLLPEESVVTREGVWAGYGWVRWIKQQKEQEGVLQREQAIRHLTLEAEKIQKQWSELNAQYEEGCTAVGEYELKRADLTEQIQLVNREWADCCAQIRIKKGQIENTHQRVTQLDKQCKEQEALLAQFNLQREEVSQELNTALQAMKQNSMTREEWLGMKEALQKKYEELHLQARQDREKSHHHEIQLTHLKTQRESVSQSIERERENVRLLESRCEQVLMALNETQPSDRNLEAEQDKVIQQQKTADEALKKTKQVLETLNQQLKEHERNRSVLESQAREAQSLLEQRRLDAQTLKVKCAGIEEVLNGLGFSIAALLETLPEEAELKAWEERLQRVHAKIKQLGPINLAALEEFKTESERKQQLDVQYNDLVQALETLEEAIRQIDKETRVRFQQTYEQVNEAFKVLFPKLFGGGRAYLELTSEDCLEAGVTVMAQPPGKRNSSIYLLSGGEKAMTAVALVFAIFQLNPSPFCMLDEVDAPLDDANVGRFCSMVKEMSSQVQFIFITHNKVTMELATHLSGVTMHEPGVSRLVAVDVDEAVSLAEA